MKKIIYIITFILFMATTVRAQFTFSTNNKVSIDSEPEVSGPLLMVGNNSYFGTSANTSIGTATALEN